MSVPNPALNPDPPQAAGERRRDRAMRAYLQISGALFGLMALGHLLRLLLHWSAEIAGYVVPTWVSVVALVLTAALSLWALRLVRDL